MPRGDHKHLSMAYKHGYKLEQKNQRGASRALFARCSRVVRALFVRCSHPQFELLIFKLERHVETWRFALYPIPLLIPGSLFVVRTSSHSLFVRVRALFVRVRVRCSRVVRTLFVRVRTSANSPANYATRPSEPEGAHKAHGKAVTQAKNDNPALRALPTASVL